VRWSHGSDVVPWQQFVCVRVFVPLCDGSENSWQISVGFDSDEFAGLDQRGDDGPILRASIMSCEECVIAVQGNGSDRSLDGIVVELDTTVIKEPAQPVPVFCNVFQSVTV